MPPPLLAPPSMVNPTPDALVSRARAGEAGAVDALFDAYGTTLLRTAYRLLASLDEAEDVVQDVFVGLPLALRHYEESGRLEAWLKRLTVRTALMRLRAGRREVHAASALPEEACAVPSGEDRVLSRLTLEAAIARLPEALRTVFVLREIEQLSHDEIATLLGIRRGTSEVRLHRAIRALRAYLENSR